VPRKSSDADPLPLQFLRLQRAVGNQAVAGLLGHATGRRLQREINAVKPLGDGSYEANQRPIGEATKELEALGKALEAIRWRLEPSTEGHCHCVVEGAVDAEKGAKAVTWITKTLYYDANCPWLDLLHEQDHIRQYEAIVKQKLDGKDSWEVEEYEDEYINAHLLTEWEDPKAKVKNEGYTGEGANPNWQPYDTKEYTAVDKKMIRGAQNDVLELHAYAREYLRLVKMQAPATTLKDIEGRATDHREPAKALIENATDDPVVAACNAVQPFDALLKEFDAARPKATVKV
jgi:hypothetical protein